MKGFHVCKPGNAPTVGQVKSLLVVGDRIKSKALDQGGANYTITAVAPRDSYKDIYGNVGYDIEIEPANGAPQAQAPAQRAFTSQAGDDRSNRIERQHSQEMAIRYWTLLASGGGITPEDCKDTKKLRAMIDWFQRDVGYTGLAKNANGPTSPEQELDPNALEGEEEAF